MTSSKPYLIRAIYEWIADNNLTPYITVDTAIQGTIVPKEYIQDERIVLDISIDSTKDLIINNDFLEFKAKFGGITHNIYIPIAAIMVIYAQENNQGMAFPSEEFDEAEELSEEEYTNEIAETSSKGKPKLTLVDGGKNSER